MPGDIGHGRAAHAGGRIVPTQTAAHGMLAVVEAVATERCQVDPADEGDLAVDDHELLVMAVHRALICVDLAANARSVCELLAHPAHGRAVGREEGQRRAAPQQHPDVDSLGQLGEQVAQPASISFARQAELGRDVPAGDMHKRASARERGGDARQRPLTVDQHLERVAGARRRIAGGPQRFAGGRGELLEPSGAFQATTMMRAYRHLDGLAQPRIDLLDRPAAWHWEGAVEPGH